MERHILFEERRLHNLIFRKMRCISGDDKERRRYKLQGMIVSYLCEHPGERICQKDLESEFFVRGSTMATAISQLEQEGYVERKSDNVDRRLKVVTPTESAKSAYENLSVHFRDMEKTLTRGISPEELSVYFKVVDKICKNLEAENK